MGLGTQPNPFGLKVHARLTTLQAIRVLLVKLPHVGGSLHRAGRWLYEGAHESFSRSMPFSMPVERLARLVLYLLLRRLLYLLLVTTRATDLPWASRHFVRTWLPPRVALLYLYCS